MKRSLRKRWQKLMADLKPMPFWKKLDHLWTYYKTEAYIAILVAMLLAIVVTSIVNLNRDVLISGVVVNDMDLEAYTALSDGYLLETDGIGSKRDVDIASVIYADPSSTEYVEDIYNYTMRVLAMVEAQSLDYLVMDKLGLEGYLSQDFFMDLRELFTPEELAQWEADLIYMEYAQTGETVPVAINLRNTGFGKSCFNDSRECYIAFAANTQRADICRDFWNYLVEYHKQE